MKVGIIVGSLRKESYSLKVAKEIGSMLPSGVEYKMINTDAPLYNEDLDNDKDIPSAWATLRADIASVDAYIFVSPEYNRTLPATIKNLIDVASRPQGKSSFGKGKRAAVVTISPGKIGGAMANHAIRQAVLFVDLIMLAQPEMYMGEIKGSFDANGKLVDNSKQYLAGFVEAFVKFASK